MATSNNPDDAHETDDTSDDTTDDTSKPSGSGESGGTTQTARDTAGGAPTTSTPPAHKRKD